VGETSQQRIVVGIRGSAAARTALAWAAREARLRQAALLVVRAWDPARHAAPYAPAGAAPTGDEEQAAARDELTGAVLDTFGLDVPACVTIEIAKGVAERVLLDRSAHADLLVLGTTSPASGAERPAGPVVRACLAHARCPVVIVGAGGAEATALPGRTLTTTGAS
jgi:nucleotide-binding universal stress UspA family protein